MNASTRKKIESLTSDMRSLTAEMKAFADTGRLPSAKAVKARPAQLQFNQAGGWRGSLSFDAGDVPDEFLQAADTMARLSGSKVGMRIVMCVPNGSGGTMATNNVLMHWTREEGWVKA